MKEVYIYGLRDPREVCIRYVGKTTNQRSRLAMHVFQGQHADEYSIPRIKWIAKILAVGLKPEMVILEIVPGGNGTSAEEKWIVDARSKGEIFNIYPFPAKEKRTKWIGFAVTPAEKTIIRLRAAQAGVKESTFLRGLCGFPE